MKNRTLNCQLFFSKTNDFLSYYLPCQAARSIHTIETYRDGLTVFRRYMTNVQKISIKKFLFTDCTSELMLDYLGYLNSQGCEAFTCNNRLAALRAYLWYASDMDISLQSIALSASHVPFLKEPKKEKQIIQDEDMKALLAAPPDTQKGNRDRMIMILLYDTTIRIAELLELKISSLKLTSVPSIHIHGKGDKERSVSITDATVSHLKKYLRQFHPEMLPDQPLFYTKIKGSIAPMSPGNVSRIINKYADAIRSEHPNLPKHLHCHMFRRTRATKGSKKGADDKETLDKMQLSIGRQRVMHQGEIYDILNHPCFYCGSSLESDQKLFIWKLEKVDISYWLAISRFFCENCDSEVAVHLFYDPKRKSFKWFVPFQQVYHASVEAEREPYLECYEVSGLVKVGEFHSHGRIPAFFSATDDEDETFPGLYGVVSCGDDRKVYRAVLGADKQIFLTEEQMKTVVYDSDEDRLSWVLGWFHQVYNKSIGNGSHYIVLVGQEKTKAIYVPSYEMARFFEGIFHVYSIDRGLRKDYCPQDHHFLISAEELTWRKGDPLLCGCGYADQLVALL